MEEVNTVLEKQEDSPQNLENGTNGTSDAIQQHSPLKETIPNTNGTSIKDQEATEENKQSQEIYIEIIQNKDQKYDLQNLKAANYAHKSKDPFEQLNDVISIMEFLQHNLRYDEAQRFLKLVDKIKFKKKMVNLPVNKQQLEIIQDVQSVYKDIQFLNSNITDNEGWTTEKFDKDLLVSYKQIESTQTVSIKIEGELDVSPFNLVALIYEIELFKNWVPFCSFAETVHQLYLFNQIIIQFQLKIPQFWQKLAFIQISLPVISYREAYLQGYGVDRSEEDGTILIVCKSIHQDFKMLKQHNIEFKNNNGVVFDLNYFYYKITPIAPNKSGISILLNLDPKVHFLPAFVVNLIIRKIGTYLIEKMFYLAKDIKGTEWETSIEKKEHKQFYEWLKSRFDTFWTNGEKKIQ